MDGWDQEDFKAFMRTLMEDASDSTVTMIHSVMYNYIVVADEHITVERKVYRDHDVKATYTK
jgi:hypothetical protein